MSLSSSERIQIAKDLSKLPVRLHTVHWGSNAADSFDLVLANQTLFKETLRKWTKLTTRNLNQISYLGTKYLIWTRQPLPPCNCKTEYHHPKCVIFIFV